jgi:hypothetical protein
MSAHDSSAHCSRFRSFDDFGTFQSLSLTGSCRGPRQHFPLAIRRLCLPSQSDPFLLLDIPSIFRTFQCQCQIIRSLCVTIVLFSLKIDGIIRFSATFKNGCQNAIRIVSGKAVHLKSGSWDGVLLHGDNFCDFSLGLNTRNDREILSMQFRKREGMQKAPRTLSAFFFNQPPSCPQRLLSADRIQTDDGWVLDIGKEDALVSIKNCRLDVFRRPYC